MVRLLLYIALSIAILVVLTPVKEQTVASPPAILQQDESQNLARLNILDVKQDKSGVSQPYFSTTIKVVVKVSNQAYSEKRDILLTLRIRETTEIEVAATSMLIYVPIGQERTYTTVILLRDAGLMVVEASLRQSDKILSQDHYYIDITPFDLI